jgi:hypothetical protein
MSKLEAFCLCNLSEVKVDAPKCKFSLGNSCFCSVEDIIQIKFLNSKKEKNPPFVHRPFGASTKIRNLGRN